ncbi:MAG TPA: matrixin family metalloprotease [Microthrixaceae bacterium]|nr:matrixin family metalloprotease [Microthrixaceae bacterium]
MRKFRVISALTAISLLSVSGFSGTAGAETGVDGPPRASVAARPDYRPLDPARIADTRPGRPTIDNQFSGTGLVTPERPLVLTVGGRGGVPSSGVAGVALNVTAIGSPGPGYVTIYPTGMPRPTASNINYDRNKTVANSVMATLSAANQVTIYSSAPAHMIVDVSGYFTTGGIAALSPARLADTRPNGVTVDNKFVRGGPISSTKVLQLKVTERGGVPANNVAAVVLNVVAVAPVSEGYLSVYPAGSPRPNASTVNFSAGQTVSNSVVVKVGSGGQVTVYASVRSTNVVVDVAGYFTTGASYVALNPARFADTRPIGVTVTGPNINPRYDSSRVGPIGTRSRIGDQIDIIVADRGAVPATDTGAVILNVTVTNPATSGYVTVFPGNSEPPTASTANFNAGQTVPNLVVAKVGRGGGISILTSSAGVDVVVDVLGYFPGVSTAGSATTWTAIMSDPFNMPVSYDRCIPIEYKINPKDAPTGWVADIKTAFAKITAATGIKFIDRGTTTEAPVPERETFDVNGDLKPLLIAFTTDSVIPDLGGSVVGIAGSNAEAAFVGGFRYLPWQFFTGDAYFDRTAGLTAGFGSGQFGSLALHELGHVVGLGHVDNVNEIMNPFLTDLAGNYGVGDLDGLGVLYKTQSCSKSPATYLAARSGPDDVASIAGKLESSGLNASDLTSVRRVTID